ncbi:hypothetical protein OQZ33_09915 [Pedobacter sp. MC2016-05]|uniref:HNH endonuclease n=1 Tax=Pedobacter sp. MC2016-05 TaxID=2994474 RepID=UPI0022469D6D|nr:HNH endonuclease [Pedobacter sp. MC2016-05]MCX2474643.1 hypothetical protein [Pedobacter sp. MC2016-05]
MPITAEDLVTIQEAIDQGGKIWENEILVDIKRRIKVHYLTITDEQCCYCRRDMTDEFNMVIDIEHVLPKSLYGNFMFRLFNLSVSCKRCNMRIKGNNIDFLLDAEGVQLNAQDRLQYLISHPNLDEYFENIEYLVNTRNNKKSVKYIKLSEKGIYTYNYFELEKLEVDTLNKAQGIDISGTELSEDISPEIAVESKELLKRI